jgi:FkbM family methyltransferase
MPFKNHLKNVTKTISFIKQGRSATDRYAMAKYLAYLLSPRIAVDYLRSGAVYKDFEKDVYISNKFGMFNCGKKWWNIYAVSEQSEPESDAHFNMENGTFLDVGAHVGKYSVYLAKKGNSVYSFEPNPYARGLLRYNIRLNKVKAKVMPYALSDKRSMRKIYINENNVGHTSLEEKVGRPVSIRTVTMDSLALKPDLIKIDVEGHELNVLKGAKNTLERYKPKLIIEVSKDQARINAMLKKMGYRNTAKNLDGLNFVFEYKR